MRITARSIVPLLVACLLIVGYFFLKPSSDEPNNSSPSESTASSTQSGRSVEDPVVEPARKVDVPEEVSDFVLAYANDAEPAEWLASMQELVTPGLHASLAVSDRDLAQGATAILEADEEHAVVGIGEQRVYTVHYRQLDHGHEHEGEEPSSKWIVTGIDYTDPPEGAALPLGVDGVEELRAPVQEALVALIAQPGGQTDEDREALLGEVFQDPQDASSVARVAPAGETVRIGNAHELVPAAEGGVLVVYATLPYQVEGEEAPVWITVTVELAHDDAGNWVPQDARL